jgi:hypothetical protein
MVARQMQWKAPNEAELKRQRPSNRVHKIPALPSHFDVRNLLTRVRSRDRESSSKPRRTSCLDMAHRDAT